MGKFATPSEVLASPKGAPTARVYYGPAETQFGDLRIPTGEGPFPIVILIHGGCWLSKFADLEFMSPLATELLRLGFVTWNIEYRCSDQTGGGWPGTFRDIGSALDFLRVLAPKYNLNLMRTIALGHSAGGHLAMWAGGRGKIFRNSELFQEHPLRLNAVVNIAGPCNLAAFSLLQIMACGEPAVEKLMGGTPESEPFRYRDGSAGDLLPLGVFQVLITGDQDAAMPPSHMEDYAGKARSAGITLKSSRSKNAATLIVFVRELMLAESFSLS